MLLAHQKVEKSLVYLYTIKNEKMKLESIEGEKFCQRYMWRRIDLNIDVCPLKSILFIK